VTAELVRTWRVPVVPIERVKHGRSGARVMWEDYRTQWAALRAGNYSLSWRSQERQMPPRRFPLMSAYLVANCRITNQEGFRKYLQQDYALAKYGGEVLAADFASEALEGKPAPRTVIIRFESKEAARGWYESAEYQAIVHYRLDSSEDGIVVICDGWERA
jgi:uncharacterized protein (DUF1330 family)